MLTNALLDKGDAQAGRGESIPPGNAAPAILHVCTTCRRMPGETEAEPGDGPRPGARLLAAIEAEIEAARAAGASIPEHLQVAGVECLSNCSRSCTVALAGEGRWSYVYGGLHPEESAADIITGAALYALSQDGIVPWKERPAIFRKGVIARVPPLATAPAAPSNLPETTP